MGLEYVCGKGHPYDTLEFDLIRKSVGAERFTLLPKRCSDIEAILAQNLSVIKYFHRSCYVNVPSEEAADLRKPFISDCWTPDSTGVGRVAGLWFPHHHVVEILPCDDFVAGADGVREERVFVTDIDTQTQDLWEHNALQWLRLKACIAYVVCKIGGSLQSSPLSLRTAKNILALADKHHIDYTYAPDYRQRLSEEKLFKASLRCNA